VSAIAWHDRTRLVAADSAELLLFDVTDGSRCSLCDLEAANADTRSNDGRADPWGGFWIGTMGIEAQAQAGSLYRWYRGELRRIASDLTVPNAACFDHERRRAYFADTVAHQLFIVELDENGWPAAPPRLFLGTSAQGLLMDGAITDALGNIHIACWDASKLVTISPDGAIVAERPVPVTRPTCPAFGGKDFATLFVTSAAVGLEGEHDGATLHALADMRERPSRASRWGIRPRG
jgi:sugar lactone lactonase YvrE